MSTRGVNQPAGSDAGKCDWAGRPSGGVSCLIRRCGICERAGRGRDTRPTPAVALRGQHPQREQGEEDHQSDRGAVTVKRGDSLLGRAGPATVAGKLTVGSIRKELGRQGHRMRLQIDGDEAVESTWRWSRSTPGRRQLSTALESSHASSSIRCDQG